MITIRDIELVTVAKVTIGIQPLDETQAQRVTGGSIFDGVIADYANPNAWGFDYNGVTTPAWDNSNVIGLTA